ncbi:hypothetical protein PR202_ga30242 [Eleusine coracana subsp. coracana]|uniref:JmjC domain-containing protein n=1 Tax=Eleusine coracana subsp. coracana TaxID=191504 RepID=A0AAV5DP70_ELECO|nr:hypothetical protein PR202_ga30242 [Eleusine coracana subsp. coracana]
MAVEEEGEGETRTGGRDNGKGKEKRRGDGDGGAFAAPARGLVVGNLVLRERRHAPGAFIEPDTDVEDDQNDEEAAGNPVTAKSVKRNHAAKKEPGQTKLKQVGSSGTSHDQMNRNDEEAAGNPVTAKSVKRNHAVKKEPGKTKLKQVGSSGTSHNQMNRNDEVAAGNPVSPKPIKRTHAVKKEPGKTELKQVDRKARCSSGTSHDQMNGNDQEVPGSPVMPKAGKRNHAVKKLPSKTNLKQVDRKARCLSGMSHDHMNGIICSLDGKENSLCEGTDKIQDQGPEIRRAEKEDSTVQSSKGKNFGIDEEAVDNRGEPKTVDRSHDPAENLLGEETEHNEVSEPLKRLPSSMAWIQGPVQAEEGDSRAQSSKGISSGTNPKKRVVWCKSCNDNCFCVPCIERWYPDLSEDEFAAKCPYCRKSCNCKPCLQKDKVKEIRNGDIPGGEEVKSPNVEPCNDLYANEGPNNAWLIWKANNDGSIPCPPKELGGCGGSVLELKRLVAAKMLLELEERAGRVVRSEIYAKAMPKSSYPCSCYDQLGKVRTQNVREAANRKGLSDNYLYCPVATGIQEDDLAHFQTHWAKGEPVIVSDVLQLTSGLSWEPLVMWRALRERKTNGDIEHKQLAVTTVDCLIGLRVYPGSVWPEMLKLKDWPSSSSFDRRLPHHGAEFISALPFPEYTDPRYGPLNLVAKLPDGALKPDLGPKADIAYGFSQELGRGDSINILTHTSEVPYCMDHLKKMEKVRKKMKEQDLKELYGVLELGTDSSDIAGDEVLTNTGQDNAEHKTNGGALWDVFRREDSDKLQDYLRNHALEFRHIHCNPVKQVIHPIHDQTFYLNEVHKRKLKEQYGVEPWTFEQKLGEAVFIPAGCPYQVRNLKSCTKVAMNFVSPENVGECIKLTEQFRRLPSHHQAKEDNLEIKRIALHALIDVLDYLDRVYYEGLSSEAGQPNNKDSPADEKSKSQDDQFKDEAGDGKPPRSPSGRQSGEVTTMPHDEAAYEMMPKRRSGRQRGERKSQADMSGDQSMGEKSRERQGGHEVDVLKNKDDNKDAPAGEEPKSQGGGQSTLMSQHGKAAGRKLLTRRNGRPKGELQTMLNNEAADENLSKMGDLKSQNDKSDQFADEKNRERTGDDGKSEDDKPDEKAAGGNKAKVQKRRQKVSCSRRM